jgi:hypothetical protein
MASVEEELRRLAVIDAQTSAEAAIGLEDHETLSLCKGIVDGARAREALASLPRGHFGRQLLLANSSLSILDRRALASGAEMAGDEPSLFRSVDERDDFFESASKSELRASLYNVHELVGGFWVETPFDPSAFTLDAAEWFLFRSSGLQISDELAQAIVGSEVVFSAGDYRLDVSDVNALRIIRVVSASLDDLRIHPDWMKVIERWSYEDGRDLEANGCSLRPRAELRRLIGVGCLNGVRVGTLIKQLDHENAIASHDIALRCAAYSWSILTPSQMKTGATLDRKTFFAYASRNPNVLASIELKSVLRGLIETLHYSR